MLDQQRVCPDPTVPPPADFRVQAADQRNHCFAQIIKKSGRLCLTLGIGVVCVCGVASLLCADQQDDGGSPHPLRTFPDKAPQGPPPPQIQQMGPTRSPCTLNCSN
jgi:hypothetical protein